MKATQTPESIKQAFDDASQYFPTPLQQFQFLDKYSRFNYELGRRETWVESVTRVVDFLKELSENLLDQKDYDRIKDGILNMQIMPSMRLMATAGEAARRNNIAIYNCSALPIDSIDAFVEELLILMAGTGAGISVEKKHVNKLPEVKIQTGVLIGTFPVPDSTEGWGKAFRLGLETWFAGKDIQFDYSLIRPAGATLKVKGGRASGPEPLRKLLDFTRKIILSRQGQKLRPIDCHDIGCMIGESIVSGGHRRSAIISLFDMDDDEMLNCKNGSNIIGNEHRWMANNSVIWTEPITAEQFLKQMYLMVSGKRGEPGIFSRLAANITKPSRRKSAEFLTNPCGEIVLRPYQFCNLSQVVARPDDTMETLKEKVELATIVGTIQSMATKFPGLRPIWKQNCEEERLLGVDINGQADCPLLQPGNRNLPTLFTTLREHAIYTNQKYAKRLGINPATSITCVKPNGNSSQLLNCSSGLHARHYKYYIRNVRVQAQSPIRRLLEAQGIPMDPENGQTKATANTYVIHFPIKSPPHALLRKDLSAVEQCEHWLKNKLYWTEGNPSVTILYHEDEAVDVIQWVWKNKDVVGGMSFLPVDDAQYKQMPYTKIEREEYEELIKKFPTIDFSQLYLYEKDDATTAAQELSCSSGSCELDYTPSGIVKKN